MKRRKFLSLAGAGTLLLPPLSSIGLPEAATPITPMKSVIPKGFVQVSEFVHIDDVVNVYHKEFIKGLK